MARSEFARTSQPRGYPIGLRGLGASVGGGIWAPTLAAIRKAERRRQKDGIGVFSFLSEIWLS